MSSSGDIDNNHLNLFRTFEVRSTLLKCVDAVKQSTGILKDATKSFQDSSFDKFAESQSLDALRPDGSLPDDQLPREIQLLAIHMDKLKSAIRETLLEAKVSSTQQKHAYGEQLKKLRDISNQAIRNAIQIERDNLNQKLSIYKTEREAKLIDEKQRIESQLSSCKKNISDLQATLDHTQQQLLESNERLRYHAEEQVRMALERSNEQHQRVIQDYQQEFKNRESAIKDEYNRLMANMENQHKNNLIDVKEASEKAVTILSIEIDALKSQLQQSNEQKEKLLQEMAMNRDATVQALEQRNADNERALRDQLAESYAMQANLKAEISVLHLKLKDELDANRIAAEQKENAVRQNLNAQHRLELEKLGEKHKTRVHLIEAELQTRHDAEIKRLKGLHQQEIDRLIREITRYKGLSIRNGPPPLPPPTASFILDSTDQSYANDITPELHTNNSQTQVGSNARRVSSYLKQLDSYISSQADVNMDDSLQYHVNNIESK